MKIKIVNQNAAERVIEKTAGKNNILLSQMKQRYESISDSAEETEFDKSCDSIGSNIRVINGSFSNLKPIEGALSFKPKVTSTPIDYEDITDDENGTNNPGPSIFKPPNMEIEENDVPSTSKLNCSNIQDGLSNMTFDFEIDVVEEKLSYQKYLEEITGFVTKTQNLVEDKLRKRTLLLKKINKYQKKIRNMEKSLRRIEKVINFGAELPNLCESFFKNT